MRIVWATIALILLSTSDGLAQFSCPDELKSMPAVDASYQRRYDTIAHRLLDDEAVTGQVTPQMYAVLDEIIDQVRAAMPPYPAHPTAAQAQDYARQVLPAVHCALIEHGFVWTNDGVLLLSDGLRLTHAENFEHYEWSDAVANTLIEARTSHDYYVIDCDIGSDIYMGVADAMHLPLAFVLVPRHAFVRWVADPAEPIDFETTAGFFPSSNVSRNGPDPFYSDLFSGLRTTHDRRHELESMTRDQILALHHGFIAVSLREKQANKARPNYRPMLREFEAALRYDSELDWVYAELAWYHGIVRPEPEMGALASDYARRAVELADDPSYRNLQACLRAQQGDFVGARRTELAPEKMRYDREDEEVGNRALAQNTDQIAHGKRCSEAQADYAAWGSP